MVFFVCLYVCFVVCLFGCLCVWELGIVHQSVCVCVCAPCLQWVNSFSLAFAGSNPVVVGMASLIPSLYEYSNATMDRLREKSLLLTAFLEHLLDRKLMGKVHVITPRDPEQRGSQLSIRIQSSFDGQKLDAKQLEHRLAEFGMIVDKRDPDILRVAPKAIYNSFEDVYRFVSFLAEHLVEEEEEGGGAVVAGSQNTGQGSRRNTRNRGRKNGGGGGDSGSSK